MSKKEETTEEALLEALRINQRVLQEMALRYQVGTKLLDNETTGDGVTNTVITRPEVIWELLRPEMGHLVQEQLRVLVLDTWNRVMAQSVVYQGNVNSSIVRPAEVLRPAVLAGAPSIIVAHNHPSDDCTPSPQDVNLTRDLVLAGKLLNIEVLDHVVIGRTNFVSMNARGLMNNP